MKKEWFLLLGTVGLTTILALGLIRWFAPSLLGIPVDLQMVRVNEKLPPFFEGVFRPNDYESREFILKDPYTRVRAKPLYPELSGMGPNDILGFRNRQVPNVADIVVIGDSQTYGNNASLEQNWPSQMAENLGLDLDKLYAMAVGGWGAVQYLDMFYNATLFQPRVIVVAMYTGNDPMDSFNMAYSYDRWRALRLNPDIKPGDAPQGTFPAPESEWWPVKFGDGIETVFTPNLRYVSNQDHPAVKAGYDVMIKVAEVINKLASDRGIQVVFTIIPTKELVYWPKVRQSKFKVPHDYTKLIEAEQHNIAVFEKAVLALGSAHYVDVVSPLQKAALQSSPLYPDNINGHPLARGYAVIGKAVSNTVAPQLPKSTNGLVALKLAEDQYQIFLVKEQVAWLFPNIQSLEANGWRFEQSEAVSFRDLAAFQRRVVNTVDRSRFGPDHR